MARTATRRSGVVRVLAWPTLRSTPWGQLTAGGGLAMLLVLATCGSADVQTHAVVDRMRVAMLLLPVGIAGTLDDPTRPHLDGAPVPLVVRQALRLVIACTVTAGWWSLTLLAAEHHPMLGHHRPRDLPMAGLTAEAVGMVAVTLAVAAVVTRSRATSGTLAAAGTALGVPALLALWPALRRAMLPTYRLTPVPGTDPSWVAAHQRWFAVALVASVVVIWALRDPARGDRRATSPADGDHNGAPDITTGLTDEGTQR